MSAKLPTSFEESTFPAHNDMWLARRETRDKVAELIKQVISKKSAAESFNTLNKALDDALLILKDDKALFGRNAWLEDDNNDGDYRTFARELSALAGHSNPIAPPLYAWFDKEKGKSYGKVTLDWQYEGPPGCVHGGILAAIFDDFLGRSQLLSGQTGATGKLTLHYHRPTPLDKELQLEGELISIKGRKITIKGSLFVDEKLAVSAEGLFITIPENVGNLLNHQQK